jgi:Uncharacterized protein conserved in bacteria
MIKWMGVIGFTLLSLASFSQSTAPVYDAALAKKLGADEYGMKQYVMAFLKSGTPIKDSVERKKVLMAHLANIQRLANEGKLLIAGPFLDNQDIKGIFIYDVKTIEEAKALTETDPGIKAGLFTMELHPWYGSAALMQLMPIHKTLQKRAITDR